jgi:hypothetical protein
LKATFNTPTTKQQEDYLLSFGAVALSQYSSTCSSSSLVPPAVLPAGGPHDYGHAVLRFTSNGCGHWPTWSHPDPGHSHRVRSSWTRHRIQGSRASISVNVLQESQEMNPFPIEAATYLKFKFKLLKIFENI